MSARPDWIAVDWGTSHLRAWAIGADGAVLDARRSDAGMGTLQPGHRQFEAALLELVEDWLHRGGPVQAVACGMVGSRQGWCEAPYVRVPAAPLSGRGLTEAPVHDARLRLSIVPGIDQINPPDVMRGEETQIAGLLTRAPGFEGVVAMPGTHTKWVQVVGGEIFHFASFLTGETFALLSRRSVLRHSLAPEGFEAGPFVEAFEDAMAHPERVSAKLFSLRAEHLLHGADPVALTSRLSGMLIGLEFAGAKPYWLGQRIALVAGGHHAERYRLALRNVGAEAEVHDPDACVLAGLAAAHARATGKETPCPVP